MTDPNKIELTVKDLAALAVVAARNGTLHHFPAVAIEWCTAASDELRALRLQVTALTAELERAKTVPMKYRRMSFNARLQEENARLSAENERLLSCLQGTSRKRWTEL